MIASTYQTVQRWSEDGWKPARVWANKEQAARWARELGERNDWPYRIVVGEFVTGDVPADQVIGYGGPAICEV